ncbi:LLM class flavin-dependent oxidoreductase [Pseudorhodobacter sp. E13]|uniref:MupA/Atu3671 family FMN-dependent luciferase-like monooxygenase n=1 Tax=Pseudorhodobacter sp. E13 TaxID=2487931 RepID=UPI000F8DE5B2|nr:MupA/Atu3671 family FMN-dependent luciferase-like monooxygenase [Pseudorhodobacter sp. E13]RUS60149.1 LLM class flavin-dependent oxidoreductase [Pseudorhodobacter sp. E13]
MSNALIIGNESLTIQCAEALLARGHSIAALVTRNADVRAWGQGKGLRVEAQDQGLADRLAGLRVDWVLSIANLNVIPAEVLSLADQAVNFHDGPLPRYAGLNAPIWAILNGEAQHGITWHRMVAGVDEGAILEQRLFDIAPTETALTLNTKCFEAAIDSFPAVLTALETNAPGVAQDLSLRSEYRRADRPAAAARLDFTQSAEQGAALVRGLDHGSYANPLALPKIEVEGRILLVTEAEILRDANGVPGAVLETTEAGLVVACASGALRLAGLQALDGAAVCPKSLGATHLPSPGGQGQAISAAIAAAAPVEGAMRRALAALTPLDLLETPTGADPDWHSLPLPHSASPFAHALGVARALGQPSVDLAVKSPQQSPYLSGWSPLHLAADATLAKAQEQFTAAWAKAETAPGFAIDLPRRDPALAGLRTPAIGLSTTGPVTGTAITLTADALHFDAARITATDAAAFVARLATLAKALATADPQSTCAALPILPAAERDLILNQWNATAKDYDRALTVHQAFEAQVAKTPDAPAVVFEGKALTYAQLNTRANRAAHVLMGMGVAPGTLVGLCATRSLDLLIGALAIFKAGGAYVPMDPAYPADRIALFIEDSAAPVIVTQSALADGLPTGSAQTLCIDTDPRIAQAPDTNPDSGVTSADLAYMIYTSGSTGRPKGVMVEHRNVANFFAGMDDRIDHSAGAVWLAVTSLSFDISVLELFWTLARGFKLVLSSDENRALVSSGTITSDKGMEFSIYYWGNDDGAGPKKYEMLLEGAKFADAHGFCAVWTPERHFHAFGGPYPNPSVTGAAVAAVTKNIGVRAGSCVAPLHHPARIAEEWAVIDNLTNGRAGLAIASGWHPDDFVLRPENTPPNNRDAMFQSIDQVRRLWRGETVDFPTAKGGSFGVATQPRPVSRELPIWVTTAGNPATWREAGEIGANVLTHLLGQSVEEVGDKIKIYHEALRKAGHDPAHFTVTLMLHTYIARDRELSREIAREPMKNYLRSAAGLIKQYAWAFPAFKKPAGVENPMQIDLQSLSDEENEAILDFAFKRYFEDSGLFGTVEDCLARVESLKRIGVTEVACLIDYGIATETVMEGLYPLAEVLRRSNQSGPEAHDFSIAAQLIRHKVTHLQCTPSMARMIAMNDDSRAALAGVKTLMLGGEALPSALVEDLNKATTARIENMYGPTETTIWSTTETATAGQGVVNIGTPIANTQVYVLDEALAPVPLGVAGELWIGGDGVTRGYWQRDDLTADRFRDNPFHPGRMYRTGDLVRWRPDGRLDFLGRADHQVKLRGYRIELGEIETVLEAQPGVAQAVVLAREDSPGDLRLVAYLRGTAAEASLRPALEAALPAHMVPQHFVTVAAFPLTPNRKVDRKALPAPTSVKAPQVESYVAPKGVAEALAVVWSRVLGVPKVGAKDNFFALGGHSLLAVQAHREIRAELGAAKLSITDIFRFPVLEALAAHIEKSGGTALAAPATATATSTATTAPATNAGNDRAEARADAMARRRAMRAGRAAS